MKAPGLFDNLLKNIRLPKLNLRLPQFQIERALLIGFVLIFVFTIGNLALTGSLLLPAYEQSTVLGSLVHQEQQKLLSARQIREQPPQVLETRIASNQRTIDRTRNLFLDESQLQAIANSVYESANLSGIALSQFAISGGPEDATLLKIFTTPTFTPAATQGAAKPTAKPVATKVTSGTVAAATPRPAATNAPTQTPTPIPPMYELRNLHLQAQGTSQRLVNFMARMRDLEAQGITITKLDMSGQADWATLTLDLALYVDTVRGTPQPLPQIRSVLAPTPAAVTMPDANVPTQTPTPFILVVPFGTAEIPTLTPTTENYYLYTVKSGDTLYTLGERFHVAAQEIVNRNALTNFELAPGQKLLIPVRQ